MSRNNPGPHICCLSLFFMTFTVKLYVDPISRRNQTGLNLVEGSYQLEFNSKEATLLEFEEGHLQWRNPILSTFKGCFIFSPSLVDLPALWVSSPLSSFSSLLLTNEVFSNTFSHSLLQMSTN